MDLGRVGGRLGCPEVKLNMSRPDTGLVSEAKKFRLYRHWGDIIGFPTREIQDQTWVQNENSASGVDCGLEGKRWRQGDHFGKCCLPCSCLDNPQLTLAKWKLC